MYIAAAWLQGQAPAIQKSKCMSQPVAGFMLHQTDIHSICISDQPCIESNSPSVVKALKLRLVQFFILEILISKDIKIHISLCFDFVEHL